VVVPSMVLASAGCAGLRETESQRWKSSAGLPDRRPALDEGSLDRT
jgi:hypothetical protein